MYDIENDKNILSHLKPEEENVIYIILMKTISFSQIFEIAYH